jgi:predicted nucleic-acid-binding protein
LKFESILNNEKRSILEALKIYNDKNLDFVDCILCAKSKNFTVKTFDKKLNKCIKTKI